jgi:PAS domain-containing protein
MSQEPVQHNLILILARQFAAQLATAVFLVDAEGTVIFYNEAAELLLGQRFIEGRGMTSGEWFTAFAPRHESGEHMPLEQLPLGVAIVEREPAHGAITIRGADGVDRRIEATAFPLFAHTEDFVGAITFFWEQQA